MPSAGALGRGVPDPCPWRGGRGKSSYSESVCSSSPGERGRGWGGVGETAQGQLFPNVPSSCHRTGRLPSRAWGWGEGRATYLWFPPLLLAAPLCSPSCSPAWNALLRLHVASPLCHRVPSCAHHPGLSGSSQHASHPPPASITVPRHSLSQHFFCPIFSFSSCGTQITCIFKVFVYLFF